MNSKMTTNSQLLTTKPKNKTKTKKHTKQTTRAGIESQKWRSHGGLSVGRGRGKMGEKVQGIRSINGRYKIDGKVKNSMGNREAKELVFTTHGHEIRGRGMLEGRGYRAEGG